MYPLTLHTSSSSTFPPPLVRLLPTCPIRLLYQHPSIRRQRDRSIFLHLQNKLQQPAAGSVLASTIAAVFFTGLCQPGSPVSYTPVIGPARLGATTDCVQ